MPVLIGIRLVAVNVIDLLLLNPPVGQDYIVTRLWCIIQISSSRMWAQGFVLLLLFWRCSYHPADAMNGTAVPVLSTIGDPTTIATTETVPSSSSSSLSSSSGQIWTTEPTLLADDRIPLYLAGLFSLDGIWDGSGVFVGADLALKHVNEDPSILGGYKLMMKLSNSQCNDGVGIQKLFKQIFQEPQKLMIIGPACSTAAQAIASTARFWNLNIMSPTASSPALSSRTKYPTFFRIIPSDTLLNPSRVSLMKLYNWTRVATIHQNHELFSESTDDLLTRLRDNNITVISSESFDEDPKNQVENLKKQDAKIIVANMYSYDMRKVICEAYKQNMFGAGYFWLLVGWYNSNWYTEENGALECTTEQMAEAVESSMYISTQARLLGGENVTTISGITVSEYQTLLEEHIQQERLSRYTLIGQAAYGYDSIWAMALALNRSAEILKTTSYDDGLRRGLENFTYSDKNMSTIFFNTLEEVYFEGVSGPVSFSGADRIGIINIEQLQGHCPDGWRLEARYCYLFIPSMVTREGAVTSCTDAGGELLSISSEEEHSAVMELASSEQDLSGVEGQWWTSLERSSGELLWSVAEFTVDDQWTPEELISETAGEDACFILDTSLDQLLPVSCEARHSFICKKVAVFQEVVIAEHDIAKNKIDWLRSIMWPGGEVPLDHTPEVIFTRVEIYEGIPTIIYVINCSLAGLGILLAIGCLIFNIYYKNQKFIKMSSPNLNSLIIIGCILIYCSTCLAGWDIGLIDEYIFLRFCQMRVWFLSIGFVLSFGSMFSKTWRVHKVAALKNPKRVIITDHHLFAMVGVLLLVDIVILTAWFIVNPMMVEREYLYEMEDLENLVISQPYIQYCTSYNNLYWQSALYGYKALLLIFGVFLAWETRKVTIPALNDSKLIGLCVYNVVLLSAIGVGVNLALTTDPSISYIFSSAIQIFCTSVTLIIIFIPKMISVKKYPEGKAVSTMRGNTTNLSSENNIGLKDEILDLKNKIQELEERKCDRKYTGCGLWCRGAVCECGERSDAYTENPMVVNSTETLTTVNTIST
ncbi:gamma-aminobutyric acid type B receptor subunit 1-like isoform X3 [Apostichopus japonicus]|uniref:gamma-aminobutyric acid type B receptor subunit 1-like isoform X3 n=1 Tax=Stichopus japonicus TaxID=307972 RepID=UPI003AB5B909